MARAPATLLQRLGRWARSRRAATPPETPVATVEELEPRLLYAADLNPALWATDTTTAPLVAPVHLQGIQNAGAEAAAAAASTASTATRQTQPQTQPQRHEIVFIDAAVPDADRLLQGLLGTRGAGAVVEVVHIAPGSDALATISDVLAQEQAQGQALDAVHIVSHGAAGQLLLGGQWLDQHTLEQQADRVQRWAGALAADADLLLWGCDVGQGRAGAAFTHELARLTGADVAASTDTTGAQARGGNWALETTTGPVAQPGLQGGTALADYSATLAVYTVSNLNDSGAGSLRQAITDANANGGADSITFSSFGTINLASALPSITGQVSINGTNAGAPGIVLNGGGSVGTGLQFDSGASNSTLRGLVVQNFSNFGIRVVGASGVTIAGNHVGTNAAGTTAAGNQVGIDLYDAPNTTVGGTVAADRNIISGNTNIGINIVGSGAGNSGTVVQGNYIGTNNVGSGALGNSFHGVYINGSTGVTIGGSAGGAGNLIGNNGTAGVTIGTTGSGNTIAGNTIGLNLAGSGTMANGAAGVWIMGSGNTVGGTTVAERNVISGNTQLGVRISGAGATGNTVLGNYLGTGLGGITDMGNGWDGVQIDTGASNNTVGGTSTGARNIIAGNNNSGVAIQDLASTGNTVLGNWIGVGANGTSSLGNNHAGVWIEGTASVIGNGTVAGRNVITANLTHGVTTVASAAGTQIRGNWIISNTGDGIDIAGNSSGSLVGGDNPAEANLIAYNSTDGVDVSTTSATAVVILGNNIYGNGERGIDLGNNGYDTNDSGDGDSGANGLQNYPVLTAASATAAGTSFSGSLNSTAHTNYRVDFYTNRPANVDGSNGEGERWLGYTVVAIDGSGTTNFAHLLSNVWINQGDRVTATATRMSGTTYVATSEFSANITGTSSNVVVVDTVSDSADGTTSSITNLGNARGADGRISLREAMAAANNTANGAAADRIVFAIAPNIESGNINTALLTPTITVGSSLTAMSQAVDIDAGTQPGYAGTPLVQLRGNGSVASGITLATGSTGSTLRGLVIGNFTTAGINVTGGNTHTIAGNWVGLGTDGATVDANGRGIILSNSTGSTIGGLNAGDRNVISANTAEQLLMDGAVNSLVYGNYVGTDATGTLDPNGTSYGIGHAGISLVNTSTGNQIGDTVAGARNLVSGNNWVGVDIASSSATNNTVSGNYIGTTVSGLAALPNATGISFWGAGTGNRAVANVLSGNAQNGVAVAQASQGATIQGNYVGVAMDGATPLANGQDGIVVYGASVNTLIGSNADGSNDAAEANVISANGLSGIVVVDTGTNGTLIQGNYIGTDASGLLDRGNAATGIEVFGGTGTTIGGSSAAQRNVISGNSLNGITLATAGVTVQGNYVGLNATGTGALGNSGSGIALGGTATSTTIGGAAAGAGNVVSGNGNPGLQFDAGSSGTVKGNRIGTNAAGTATIAGTGAGIFVASSNVQVGGTLTGEGNTIAGSDTAGIIVSGSVSGNAMLGNSIYGNAGLAIDLANDGVTANDAAPDSDTGANNLQNFPVLATASTDAGSQLTVTGTLAGTANSFFRIEFFANTSQHATGYGAAQTYLGFANVATDGSGHGAINAVLSANVAVGVFISATATRATDGSYNSFTDTSELARNIAAVSSTQATVTVDTTSDLSDGDTSTLSTLIANKGADGFISLREAITAANNTANGSGGADRISFAISGTGVHTLTPATALPAISDAVVLDASTDDSFAANGNRPAVVLDGNDLAASGLTFNDGSDGSVLRGFVIRNFGNHGVLVNAGADGLTVVNNYLGAFDTQGQALPSTSANGGHGIWATSNNSAFGGSTAQDRNLIGGNGIRGIELIGNGNTITGNWFGVAADGTTANSNAGASNLVLNGNNNRVGGTLAGQGNILANAAWRGVGISGVGNAVLGNSIYGNQLLGIELGDDGVTLNDPGDADTGANNLQNFPVLTAANTNGTSQLAVVGTLNSHANSWYRIEFFSNPTGDPTGYGEGQTYLGFVNVATDGAGNASFSTLLLGVVVPAGSQVSATATASNAAYNTFTDTSEFAQNATASLMAPHDLVAVPAVPKAGLPGYYGFSDPDTLGRNDAGGTAITLVGSPGQTTGPDGSGALDLAGGSSGQYGQIAGLSTGGAMTLAASVRFDSTGSFQRVLDFGTTDAGGIGAIYVARLMSSNDLTFGIELNGSYTYRATAANAISNGSWLHVAATVDAGGQMVLYVNGVQAATTSGVVPTEGMRPNNYIGKSNWAADAAFDGAIDNLVIARGAMTAAQVAALYNQSTGFAVNENAAAGTVLGTLVGLDPDASHTLSYSLSDSAGGRFAIDAATGTVTVANGALLDFEAAGSHSITAVVTNNDGLSYNETFTVTLVDRNDAPTNTLPAAPTTNEDTALVFSTAGGNAISIADADAGGANNQVTLSVTNGTLTLSGTAGLSFTSGDGTADATMTLRGTAAAINAALDGLVFNPTADTNGGAVLSLSSTDSVLLSLNIDTGLVGRYAFENPGNLGQDSSPAAGNPAATVGAASVVDGSRGAVLALNGSSNSNLQVSGLMGTPSNVTLAAWVNLSTADTGGAEVISLGDNLILRVDGGTGRNELMGAALLGGQWTSLVFNTALAGTGWHHVAFTFDDAGNTAALYLDGQQVAQAVAVGSIGYTRGTSTLIGTHGNGGTAFDFNGSLDEVRIYNRALTANEVATLARDLAMTRSDTLAIAVAAVNDAPVLATTGGTINFTENGAALVVDAGITVSDVDSATLVGATVSISANYDGAGGDELQFANQNGITGSWNAGTGVLTLSGSATVAHYQAALRSVSFVTPSDAPGTGTRTVSFTVNDGTDISLAATRDVALTAVNDAPVLNTAALTLMEGETVTLSAANFGITDPDSASFTYTVSGVAGGYFQLSSAAGTPVSSFTTADLVGGLVQFVDDGNEVAPAFSVTVNDGALSSNTLAASVSYTPVNDAPVLSSATLTLNEGETVTLAPANFGITDPDSASFTYTVSGVAGGYFQLSSAAGTPVTTFTTADLAGGLVQFVDDGNEVAPAFSVTVNDGALSSNTLAASISYTPVNDAPVLSSATLTLNEGETVTLAPANFGITDPDSASFTYTVSGVAGGYFQLSSAAGTPVTTFTTADLAGGLVQFVDDGNEAAPAFSVTVNDGALNSNTLVASISYTPVNDAPVLSSATLTLNEGETVTLAPTNFGITDPDSASFTYTVSGVAGGYFELSSAAGSAVTTFTTADLAGGLVQFVDDGDEVAPAFSVTVNDGALNSNTLAASVTYTPINDAPVVSSATLTLNEGETVTLAPANFGIADPDSASFTYTVSGVAGGYFQLSSAAGTAVTTFTTADLAGGLVQFVDDGNEVAPAFSVTVNDGALSSNTLVASITYTPVNDAPVVNSAALTLNEGETVTLSAANFGITDTDSASFTYTVSGVAGGYFQLSSAAGTPVTSFTTADLVGGLVQFVDDGNEVAPAFSVTVNDGALNSNTLAASVTYTPVNDAPVVSSATLTLNEGETVTLAPANFGITDPDSATFIYTVSGVAGGYFQLSSAAGSAVTTFTTADLAGGLVQFVDDGNEVAPAFSVTVNDGALNSNTLAASVPYTPVNDAPVVNSAALTLNEGETVTLSAANFGITDPDSASFAYTVSGLSGGHFQLSSAAGSPVTTFTTADLAGGLVQFVDDGNEVAPAFSVTVNDGALNSNTLAASISYTPVNDAPVISSATLTLNEGETVTLAPANFGITDPDSASFTYTVSGVSGGYFQLSSAAGTTVTTFTTADLAGGLVQFVDDGNEVAPAFSVMVNDGALNSNTLAASVTYTSVNDAPVVSSATLTLNEGETVTLAPANFGITDPDSASFTYTVSGLSGGYFQLSSAAGSAVTTFTTADLAGGLVQFVDDGNEVAPAFSVTVNDGALSSNTLAATITYTPVNDSPVVTSATLTLNEGETVTLAPANFGFTDPDSGSFTYTVSGVAGGYFQLSSAAGTPVTTFTTADLAGGLVQFVDDGNEVAPAFSVTVNDGALNSNTLAASISYTPVNDAPVVTSATLTLNEGETVTLAPANFGITDPDSTSFTYTVSGLSGGYFQLSSAAGTPVTTFTTADLAAGLVQFVDDGNELPPAYSVTASDGALNSNTQSATITYTPVNDAPSITGLDGKRLNYTEGDGLRAFDGAGDSGVQDPDSPDLAGGRLAVTGHSGWQANQDVLGLRNQGMGSGQIGVEGSQVFFEGVAIGSFSGGTGGAALVVDFNLQATPGAATALLHSLAYENTNTASPAAGLRSVQLQLTDGDGGSSPVQNITIQVTALDDAPGGMPLTLGLPAENQVLSADVSAVTDPDGLGPLAFQWLRDGAPIGNATGTSYQLGPDDVGSNVQVRVSWVDGLGRAESLTSGSLGRVARALVAQQATDSSPPAPAPAPAPALAPTAAPQTTAKASAPAPAPAADPTDKNTAAGANGTANPDSSGTGATSPARIEGPGDNGSAATFSTAAAPRMRLDAAFTADATALLIGMAGDREVGRATPMVSFEWNSGMADGNSQQASDAAGRETPRVQWRTSGTGNSSSSGVGDEWSRIDYDQGELDDGSALIRILSNPAPAASAGLTAGLLWWLTRSGGLLTSILMGVPAWRHIDLLPVLVRPVEDAPEKPGEAHESDATEPEPGAEAFEDSAIAMMFDESAAEASAGSMR